jgi:phosphohistidine phosphatase SixA
VFILVRHALALNKQRWSGPDRARPLSRRGVQQSEVLVSLLASQDVTRLLTSPAERCRLTLLPASEKLGIPIEPVGALAVNAPIGELLDLLGSSEVDHAALCTHGEMFAALSREWGINWTSEFGPPDLATTPKGGCWVIEGYNTGTASARYLGSNLPY